MSEPETRTLSDKFMLRLPDGMRDRIKAAADANNRSMNSEILATLHKAYPDRLTAISAEFFESLTRYLSDDSLGGDIETRLQEVRSLLTKRGATVEVTHDEEGNETVSMSLELKPVARG